jgi:hypothetical protein
MSGMGEPPLGGPKMAPRNIQSALSIPLQNDHLPERRKPPLSAFAVPLGEKLDACRQRMRRAPIFALERLRIERDDQVMNGHH